MSDMNLLADLSALGFTEYEGKVYLALLKESPANGYQLSKRTGVPRSMVYEALARLHTRGAILKSGDERATIYRPIPPEHLLQRFNRQHQQLIDRLHDSLLTIYDSQMEASLWTINGKEATFSYISQMITNAAKDLYLVLDDTALDQLRDDIIAAWRRGIQVGALMTGNGELKCSQVYYHPPAESELQGLENILVVVVDGEECLITDLSQDIIATITTNKSLVLISQQFVWMELFAQRINEHIGSDMLTSLDESDRKILESFSTQV
jgi:sugar-specific transcriptional regulator TrmB